MTTTGVLPDNSIAFNLYLTPVAATAASAFKCMEGMDDDCITWYGTGACCFMATVESLKEDPTQL